jgi:3'-phosphoadenosine 5'-phosphosulfate sulfotransferase (PAPS reductase)/FAD synthetase
MQFDYEFIISDRRKKPVDGFDVDNYKMNLEEGVKNVVSFSGGKDSTAIVLLLTEKEIEIEEIIFFDSGWEWDEIVVHNRDLEKYLNRKITRLKPENSFEWWMYEKEIDGPNYKNKGKGWPRFNLRWCTGVMQTTIRNYLKKFGDVYYNHVGICYDEGYRLAKRPKNHFERFKYPLIEFKIKESEAKQICFDHGFDFGGLYQYMESTSCWCCPLQPLSSLRNLFRNFPHKWQQLLEMGKKTSTPFKIGKNVSDGKYLEEYDLRFRKELWNEMNQRKITEFL